MRIIVADWLDHADWPLSKDNRREFAIDDLLKQRFTFINKAESASDFAAVRRFKADVIQIFKKINLLNEKIIGEMTLTTLMMHETLFSQLTNDRFSKETI